VTASPRRRRGRLPGALAILVGAALALPLLGCGGSGGGDRGSEVPSGAVEVGDFFFRPADKQVHVGDTVTWLNTGEQLHTVKGPGFASHAFGGGQSYRFRFKRPGTYRYICTLHPTLMKGVIVAR
jgi:plastocyanin